MANKILYVCQEITPYLPETEASGLCRALTQAMQERGNEIRTFMPRYGCINERRHQLHEVIRLSGMNLIIDDNDHQLIIKVASIPAARVQIYFIDNDDYFSRKAVLTDSEGAEFPDNDERAIFFARGVLETVKKLRWTPTIVHCHGWFSGVIPVYLKRVFADDPIFRDVKVVVSLYADGFPGELDKGFAAKIAGEGVKDKNLAILDVPSYENLCRFVMEYADGVVAASVDADPKVLEIARASGKPMLEYRRLLRAAAVVTAVAAMTFAGCTKVDDTLGSNLVPDNQQMKAGYQTFGALTLTGDLNPRRYVETRLYQTDSLITSNLTYGYMGSMLSDTFGLRTAGFLTQYVPYEIDSGYFGFRPILDSAIILLSISSYGSDTLTSQEYNVYEVVSNKYLTEKPVESGKSERDTTFYLNFDPVKAGVVGDDVLFTFTFPDGKTTGPATTYTTMKPTPKGREFINRLMLQEGTYKGDYSIYSLDSLEQWVAEFKGLYIVPAVDQTTPNKGNIYATSLDASGFAIYGRNRLESDPTLIADTISIPYIFYDSSVDYGNVSVNTIRHDYSKATSPQRFDIADAVETNENRPLSKQVYVEGMGGVVTEMTFTEEFFRQLAQIIKDENAASAKEFNTLAINQARMSVYFAGSNYDWQNLTDVKHMIEQMDASQSRLGLYTNYKKLSGITDYAYAYEKTYSTTLTYGGYINRSRGCYVMDITGHVQSMWNYYQEAVKELGENAPWEEIAERIKTRTMYMGPEAYGLYTQNYSVMQGMTPSDGSLTKEDAPIKIDIAYTLVK